MAELSEVYANLLGSSTAGAIARFICHPIGELAHPCILRVLNQSRYDQESRPDLLILDPRDHSRHSSTRGLASFLPWSGSCCGGRSAGGLFVPDHL